MEPHGIYNLTIENQPSGRLSSRIGLLRHRTGVPVVPLFLEEVKHPLSRELHSLEDIETQVLSSSSAWDKAAWETLLPFFEMGGTQAHVVSLPLPSERCDRLAAMIGFDRGLRHRTGIHALKNFAEQADLIVVPQASMGLSLEEHRIFYHTLFDVISPMAHFFTLVDFPKNTDEGSVQTWLSGTFCADAAAYFPWLLHGKRLTPPAMVTAAAFQSSDSFHGINEIPANRVLSGEYQPLRRFSPAQLQDLLEHRVNLFHQFGTGEVRIWGGRTLADPMDLDNRFISTRRTMLALREAIHQICEPFVLEPMQEGLANLVDVALQSAFQPIVKVFDPNAKNPFQTNIEVVSNGAEDVLKVDVTFSIPYAVDQLSVSLGLTG